MMNTLKKALSTLLASALLLGLLSACGGNKTAPQTNPPETSAPETQAPETAKPDVFPFSLITKNEQEVTFTKVPETVLCTNVNTGDQLMALGLGDKIIYTANNNTQVAPAFREAYEAIPQLDDKPTLEVILDMEPDFVYGRSSAFSEKYNTEHDTLSQYGIMSLSSIEGYTLGADVEDVYQDFYNLGRLFQVEDRANEIVDQMKEKIDKVEKAVAGTEPVKVFVFDMARENGAYTCGDNFTAKLIEHAGGENIFLDLDTTWADVSWEEVVARAPEVIIINDYGKTSLEEKIAQLKENPALATVPAIQNDRITSVTLCESFASSMTADVIEKFAQVFHPDCF